MVVAVGRQKEMKEETVALMIARLVKISGKM